MKGIHTPKGFFKVSAYADDVTVGLGDLDDVNEVIKLLNTFGKFSGLEINLEKCEILCLNGSVTQNNTIRETSYIKITGVVFGEKKNQSSIEKMNFEPALNNIRNKLNIWKMRALTILGKVTVVKAFALSQIQFLASTIKTPPWVIKELTDIVRNFVWNGVNRISVVKASKTWKEGGLTLPKMDNLCAAAYVKTTLRAKNFEKDFLWAGNFMHEVRKLGGMAPFHPQADIVEIGKTGAPDYIMSQIEAWQSLQKELYKDWSKEITEDTPICYNKTFQAPLPGKSKKMAIITVPNLRKVGLSTVGKWFNHRAERISLEEAKQKGLKASAWLEWVKVAKTLWRNKIAIANTNDLQVEDKDYSFYPFFKTERGRIEGSDITQKRILEEIAKAALYIPNENQLKVQEVLGLEEEEVKIAFRNFKKDNPCTWKQDFQFKLLSGAVFTNTRYIHMGHKKTTACTFCNEPYQDFVHLFTLCPGVRRFRERLAANWQGDPMDKKRWFLGASATSDILEKSKNIIAKEANHFIFKTNWAGNELSVEAFKRWLQSDEEPEEALACRVNKLFDHQIKWSYLQTLLT